MKDFTQYAIYCLFLHLDGTFSKERMQKLSEICKSQNLDKSETPSVSYFFSHLDLEKDADNSEVVIKELKKLFKKDAPDKYEIGEYNTVLWMLVLLAYSDNVYTDAEKKVINYLINKLKVDKQLYDQMIDTAETALMLTAQKERLLAANESVEYIDDTIKDLYKDMEIELADRQVI